MSIAVQWLSHASFRISNQAIVYIDPWKLSDAPHDGDVILVSHSHYDHYSAEDIANVSGPQAKLIAPADVVSEHGSGDVITPGQTIELDQLSITAVAAYNPSKQFHPKGNKWVGFIVKIDGKRIYYAGDTDLTPEMQQVGKIDLALLPVGGTYTLDASEAVKAIEHIKPAQAVPYHWGDIVGTRQDAEVFYAQANCDASLLYPGDSLTL